MMQLPYVDWFTQEVVHAGAEGGLAFGWSNAGSQGNDWQT